MSEQDTNTPPLPPDNPDEPKKPPRKSVSEILDLKRAEKSAKAYSRAAQHYQRKVKKLKKEKPEKYIEKGDCHSLIISPDIEHELFPLYLAGMSVRRIYETKCKNMGVSIATLYDAKAYYKWDKRVAEVRNKVLNDNNLDLTVKFKNYITFVDDLISKSMKDFYTDDQYQLQIHEMKDLKQAIEIITHLLHGGIKKTEVKVTELTDDKAAKVLEVLAESEEAEFTEAIKDTDTENKDV